MSFDHNFQFVTLQTCIELKCAYALFPLPRGGAADSGGFSLALLSYGSLCIGAFSTCWFLPERGHSYGGKVDQWSLDDFVPSVYLDSLGLPLHHWQCFYFVN